MALWTIMMQPKDKLVQRLWSLWCVLITRSGFQSRWSFFSCSSFSMANGMLQTERNCISLTRAKPSSCHLLVPQSKQNKHFSPPCSCLTVTFFFLPFYHFHPQDLPTHPFLFSFLTFSLRRYIVETENKRQVYNQNSAQQIDTEAGKKKPGYHYMIEFKDSNKHKEDDKTLPQNRQVTSFKKDMSAPSSSMSPAPSSRKTCHLTPK